MTSIREGGQGTYKGSYFDLVLTNRDQKSSKNIELTSFAHGPKGTRNIQTLKKPKDGSSINSLILDFRTDELTSYCLVLRRHRTGSVDRSSHDGEAQASDRWTAKVEKTQNSGLFQSGLCQSQPVLICKDSVKMQTKTG